MPTYPNLNKTPGQPPRFDRPIDDILADIKRDLLECKPGQAVEIKRKRKPKSQKQLGNIFGNMIAKIANMANVERQDGVDGLLKYLVDESQVKGCSASTDFIKELCYTIAPTYKDGRRLTLRSMDTLQASDFFKRAAHIMSGYVEIPDPTTELRKEMKDGRLGKD